MRINRSSKKFFSAFIASVLASSTLVVGAQVSHAASSPLVAPAETRVLAGFWTKLNPASIQLDVNTIVRVSVSVGQGSGDSLVFSRPPTSLGIAIDPAYSDSEYTSWKETVFRSTVANANLALNSLFVKSNNSATDVSESVKIVVLTDSDSFNPVNEHYYRFIPSPRITFADAKAAAEALTLQGVAGHLATITTEAENSFVTSKILNVQNAWIGASDAEVEGRWKWVTGPEAGTVFWEANCAATATCVGNLPGGAYEDAAPIVNTYSHWDTHEPNNWTQGQPNGEDFGLTNKLDRQVTPNTVRVGLWNDVPGDTSAGASGYVVEFSGTIDPTAPNGYSETFKVEAKYTTIAKPTITKLSRHGKKLIAIWKVANNTVPGLAVAKGSSGSANCQGTIISKGLASCIITLPKTGTYAVTASTFVGTRENKSAAQVSSKDSADLLFGAIALVSTIGDNIKFGVGNVVKAFSLLPKSPWKLRMFSTEIALADGEAGDDGEMTAEFDLPETIEAGEHRIVFTATDASGVEGSITLNLTIDEDGVITALDQDALELPATGSQGSSVILMLASLLAMLGIAIALLSRRKLA